MQLTETKNTLAFTTALTALSATIEGNGIVVGYTLVLPNFTTAASAILTVKDADGYTVYTGDSKNENATYTVMSMSGLCPIGYGYTITLTLNAQSGGSHDAVVKLYIA